MQRPFVKASVRGELFQITGTFSYYRTKSLRRYRAQSYVQTCQDGAVGVVQSEL